MLPLISFVFLSAMANKFKVGDRKTHSFVVGEEDFAQFDSGLVHKVCSTFKLAKEMEWAGRLFVLEMRGPEEEGIGTFLEIRHDNPAFEDDKVDLVAEYVGWESGELIVKVKALVGERLVAKGRTGQKIINKDALKRRFEQISKN